MKEPAGENNAKVSVGLDSLTVFLKKEYLEGYIPFGGSKMKFVTGRQGSGKTHLAACVRQEAEGLGYKTVSFSARDIWLHDFREIYLEILRQCDMEHVLQGCADRISLELGYDPAKISEGQNLMDYLSELGEADPLIRGEIRSLLREKFVRNPRLDHNFGYACSLIVGGMLGHPMLEEANRDLLLAFLQGDKKIKLAQLRSLGLSPSRVTRYNARNLLRSLSELIHLGGYAGLLVVIDDMEILLNRTAGEMKRYTKLRREDAYESIRQLIDDIDNMRYILFLFCFDRDLIDNENYGVKSYQALWLRIQNEVVSPRFNCFADIIDMDRYGDEFYSENILAEMAENFRSLLSSQGCETRRLPAEEIKGLYERAQFGGLGLPGLLYRAVSGKEENHG